MTPSSTPASDKQVTLQALNLPFDTFRLDNGLTVIVHEDRKAPVVAVNITYKVGSKDEPPGKTGFAHLFEHLMFCGSAHLPGSYLANLLNAGASEVNGSTSRDRTNYHETVPTSLLDYALFAESDRMGHFLDALTQEGLDQQRGVVSNEKHQNEGQPYGRVHGRLLVAMFAPQHPYAHEVIGSMDDLARATLDDARDWFATFYGPSNCVLCLAGDIDVATARQKVAQFFDHIPPGRTPIRRTTHARPPRLSEPLRETVQDQVPLARLVIAWHLPCLTDPDTTALQATAVLLAGSRSARLQRVLVDCDDPLAMAVSCSVDPGELCSLFKITVMARDADFDAAQCEARIHRELEALAGNGPSAEDLRILKQSVEANFIRGLADANSVAALLGDSFREYGVAEGYRVWIQQFVELTPSAIAAAVGRWITAAHALRLEVEPVPVFKEGPAGDGRFAPPPLGVAPAPRMPALQRATLSNGLQVVFAERRELPLLEFQLIFNGGHASDPAGQEGIARLTAALMNGAAGDRDEFEASQHLQSLGTELQVVADSDDAVIHLSCLRNSLDASLAALSDVLLRPRFEEAAVVRDIHLQRQSILMDMASPSRAVNHVLPTLLFPSGHPYSRPWTGAGNVEALDRMTRDDLLRSHAATYRPGGATLVVVGDTDLAELLPQLEARLAQGWRGTVSEPASGKTQTPQPIWQPGVNVMHRPAPDQSTIVAALLMPPAEADADVALDVIDQILGRNFGSRINMNLREDKHWTYGSQSALLNLRGPRPYLIQAAVQADQTVAAMGEIAADLQGIVGQRPLTQTELDDIQRSESSRLAALTETSSGLCSAIAHLVRRQLPDDHWQTRAARLQALDLDTIQAAARRLFDGPGLLWLVIGESSQLETQLRVANRGEWKTV